jgi:hypothetical protein
MSRRLTAVAFLAAMALVVSSAFGQTTTPKKKKKKKHPKKPVATATIELDSDAGAPPPTATPTPTPTPPANATPTPAEPATPPADENATPAGDSTASEPAKSDAAPSTATPLAMPWSAAVLLGYGFDGAEHLGLGVRGGYTLPMHVYLGVTFVYHLGSSTAGVSTSLPYPGLEGGYELEAGPLVVRPYVGFGPVLARVSLPTTQVDGVAEGGGTTVTTLFGVWAGGLAVVPFADRFFAGGDLRLVVVSGYTTAGFFLTGGARF